MSKNYDNWERLVDAVLLREWDRQIALIPSPDLSSIGSPSSTISKSTSRSDHDEYSLVHRQRREVPMDYSDLTLNHSEWKAMLPRDKHEVVIRSTSLSFFLDQRSRKNCFLLGAGKLVLLHEEEEVSSPYWERKSHSKSRFSEVIELVDWCPLYIQGEIHAKMLSPETSYAAYFVFGYTKRLTNLELTSSVTFSNNGDYSKYQTSIVPFLSTKHRADGWMEVEIGSFYVPRHSENGRIEVKLVPPLSNTIDVMSRVDVEGIEFRLDVEGIEFRPAKGKGIFSNLRFSSKA